MRHLCPTVPIVLVGTKLDLKDVSETFEKLNKRGLAPIKIEQERMQQAFYYSLNISYKESGNCSFKNELLGKWL